MLQEIVFHDEIFTNPERAEFQGRNILKAENLQGSTGLKYYVKWFKLFYVNLSISWYSTTVLTIFPKTPAPMWSILNL